MSLIFNEQSQQEIEKLLRRYPNKQAALLPVLHVAEKEFGWISQEVMDLVAQRLEVSPAHVYGVVTFYTMYKQKRPAKYCLKVCQTLPCMLMGSENVIAHLEKRLGIKAGETTPENRFSLETVECLASCGTAPAMMVNEKYYENLSEDEIDRVLDKLNQ